MKENQEQNECVFVLESKKCSLDCSYNVKGKCLATKKDLVEVGAIKGFLKQCKEASGKAWK